MDLSPRPRFWYQEITVKVRDATVGSEVEIRADDISNGGNDRGGTGTRCKSNVDRGQKMTILSSSLAARQPRSILGFPSRNDPKWLKICSSLGTS